MIFKKSLSQIYIIFFIASMIIFVACKKETSASNVNDEKNFAKLSSASNIESSQLFDDVYNNVMGVNSEVALGGTGVFSRIITVDSVVNPGFIVTITRLNLPALFPVKIDLDFGVGCMGKDGVNRKGKLTVIYSGPLTIAGSKAETSFENFYINDTKVEGAYVIQNISLSQQLIFKETIQNGKLTNLNSNYSLWNSNNTITQIDGLATPTIAKDDVLSITGESNGSLTNDTIFLKWNSKIEEPLIKKFSCRWIEKGKIGIAGVNTDAAIIDFGNGDCDNKASLIINTSTTEITLH